MCEAIQTRLEIAQFLAKLIELAALEQLPVFVDQELAQATLGAIADGLRLEYTGACCAGHPVSDDIADQPAQVLLDIPAQMLRNLADRGRDHDVAFNLEMAGQPDRTLAHRAEQRAEGGGERQCHTWRVDAGEFKRAIVGDAGISRHRTQRRNHHHPHRAAAVGAQPVAGP